VPRLRHSARYPAAAPGWCGHQLNTGWLINQPASASELGGPGDPMPGPLNTMAAGTVAVASPGLDPTTVTRPLSPRATDQDQDRRGRASVYSGCLPRFPASQY
jgi:hypothetical protein